VCGASSNKAGEELRITLERDLPRHRTRVWALRPGPAQRRRGGAPAGNWLAAGRPSRWVRASRWYVESSRPRSARSICCAVTASGRTVAVEVKTTAARSMASSQLTRYLETCSIETRLLGPGVWAWFAGAGDQNTAGALFFAGDRGQSVCVRRRLRRTSPRHRHERRGVSSSARRIGARARATPWRGFERGKANCVLKSVSNMYARYVGGGTGERRGGGAWPGRRTTRDRAGRRRGVPSSRWWQRPIPCRVELDGDPVGSVAHHGELAVIGCDRDTTSSAPGSGAPVRRATRSRSAGTRPCMSTSCRNRYPGDPARCRADSACDSGCNALSAARYRPPHDSSAHAREYARRAAESAVRPLVAPGRAW